MQILSNLWKHFLIFLNRRINEKDLKHKRLALNPNDFLDKRIVLYFETKQSPLINKFLTANYHRINKSLSKKGMQFIYIPQIANQSDEALKGNIASYLKYNYPGLINGADDTTNQIVESLFKKNDLSLYYKILGETLNIPEDCSPCLIHCIDFETNFGPDRKWEYSIFSLSAEKRSTLQLQINYYLEKVGLPSSNIFLSLKDRKDEPYDADERFFIDGHYIGDDIKQAIDIIKNLSNEKVLLSSLVYLINNLKDTHPEICKKLNENIFKQTGQFENKLSRVVIDEKYRIWLPDYQNIEIELTPLPKTFYFFMLKHPEGIAFKELPKYRSELINIYTKVGNRYDLDQIQKSIIDLTDIRSNSVNEKCSRIKEAFLRKIDDSLAKNYYITGSRNDLKSIKLDPRLVHFILNA
jgi:hypothetical protein